MTTADLVLALHHETYLRMCGLWEDEHCEYFVWLDDDRTDDYTPAAELAASFGGQR